MTIGQRIIELRIAKGFSQKTLAERSGISQSAISLIEKDQRDPSTKTLALLADALGTTSANLLGDAEAMTISDDDIKFALFDGEKGITDEQFEEVKRFARYIASQKSTK